MQDLKIAVVGATGMVGQEFIKILKQRNIPAKNLRLLASARSAGSIVYYGSNEITVEETTPSSFNGINIALFSAGGDVSRYYAPLAVKAGATVIDNSSAWRMDPEVPLVIPEVNAADLEQHNGIIANPNCSTIQMLMALAPLHRINPVKRIIVSTYQSVSGAGGKAVFELQTQSRQVLDGQSVNPHVFPHQIAFNVLPHIDVFLDNGFTKEEMKMVNETHKMLHDYSIIVTATCARVPVLNGHSESITVEFYESMPADEARGILTMVKGVKVLDDPTINVYPQPWSATGSDDTFVGRIRQDLSQPNCINMWVVADNIRKGAALNAIQIAETLAANDWVKAKGVR